MTICVCVCVRVCMVSCPHDISQLPLPLPIFCNHLQDDNAWQPARKSNGNPSTVCVFMLMLISFHIQYIYIVFILEPCHELWEQTSVPPVDSTRPCRPCRPCSGPSWVVRCSFPCRFLRWWCGRSEHWQIALRGRLGSEVRSAFTATCWYLWVMGHIDPENHIFQPRTYDRVPGLR